VVRLVRLNVCTEQRERCHPPDQRKAKTTQAGNLKEGETLTQWN